MRCTKAWQAPGLHQAWNARSSPSPTRIHARQCVRQCMHPSACLFMCVCACTARPAEDEPAAAGGEPAAGAAEQQAGEAGPSSSKPSGSRKRKAAAAGEGEGWGKIEEGLSGGRRCLGAHAWVAC